MSEQPDFIEPFVGWKGLLADAEGGLWSPSLETFWPEYEPLVATCTNAKHEPPVASCMCGIYAVKSFDDLREHGYNWGGPRVGLGGIARLTDDTEKVWVLAEITLYGRVRPGRIGYRASKAYPRKAYVPGWRMPLGAKIRDRYGVPIGMIDRFSGRRI